MLPVTISHSGADIVVEPISTASPKICFLDPAQIPTILVFLCNAIGIKNHAKETITSIVNMRNYLLSKFLLQPEDVVFLRGAQEEMFSKLLQLQIAPNPVEIIDWIFSHGVDKTIQSYNNY